MEIAHDSIKLGDATATDALAQLRNNASSVALVLGNEIDGVQEAVMELCDGSMEIPQAGTKHSLNVSCAAAIAIWEIYKTLRA